MGEYLTEILQLEPPPIPIPDILEADAVLVADGIPAMLVTADDMVMVEVPDAMLIPSMVQ